MAPPVRTVSHPPGGKAGTPKPAATANVEDGYTVQRGDTLYAIAFRHQLDYHELADWNGIGRDYAIRSGQVLRLTPPERGIASPPAMQEAPVSAPASSAGMPRPPSSTAAAAPTLPSVGRPIPPRPEKSAASSQEASTVTEPAGTLITTGDWRWPTAGRVVRGFGDDASAKGLDIAGTRGQPVTAARAGKVVYSGAALKGYGELIILKHDETFLSAYGYNRRRLVEEGTSVAAGQPIAEMGDGPEQRPLLHFELRARGRPIDPTPLLPSR